EFHSKARMALDVMQNAAASGKPFHIAVVDYYLHPMNGKQFIEEVRNRELLKTRFLALYNGDPGGLEKVKQDGFHGAIIKPFSPSWLMEQLAELWSQYGREGDGG